MSMSDVAAQENSSVQEQFERIRARISRMSGAKRIYTAKADRMEELRLALIDARLAHAKSHADVAARVGVCRHTVMRWETREGFAAVRFSQVLDWAAYLGVDV